MSDKSWCCAALICKYELRDHGKTSAGWGDAKSAFRLKHAAAIWVNYRGAKVKHSPAIPPLSLHSPESYPSVMARHCVPFPDAGGPKIKIFSGFGAAASSSPAPNATIYNDIIFIFFLIRRH